MAQINSLYACLKSFLINEEVTYKKIESSITVLEIASRSNNPNLISKILEYP
jgi:hypothetical protein